MIHEIKQFCAALSAKIYAQDEELLCKYLNHNEKQLFLRQRIFIQRHAFDTAHRILGYIEGTESINNNLIMKAALLHDVGKSYVFLPFWVAPVSVLIKKFFHRLLPLLTNKGSHHNSPLLWKYFYTYEFHPEIGEKMLSELAVEKEVLMLVRQHHKPPGPNEPIELSLLRRADEVA
jgi:hypothetical protein